MKNIILILLIVLSCKKKETKPTEDPAPIKKCFDMELIKDINWKVDASGYDCPKLQSDWKYYEGGKYIGTWRHNNCDSIYVSNPSIPANNFSYKLSKLTKDTLIVITARFGVTLFKK